MVVYYCDAMFGLRMFQSCFFSLLMIISIINDNGGNFQQVTSEDGLTNTISMTFTNEVYNAKMVNEQLVEDMDKRLNYCNDNSISYNILDPA